MGESTEPVEDRIREKIEVALMSWQGRISFFACELLSAF
ncbi:hypothetical protein COLO4_13229 [Corchorus olitorius]|uniref:Uncharacterized protein n=1 Tax=Corchorus olitorius TaxID=93759 RepID=A0A1R3JXF4_9ROSI|nr:hypothetical protein COLO4_13229 [Corchorus olitorius]